MTTKTSNEDRASGESPRPPLSSDVVETAGYVEDLLVGLRKLVEDKGGGHLSLVAYFLWMAQRAAAEAVEETVH